MAEPAMAPMAEQSTKTLAILELKDGHIETLERQLDLVQSKVIGLKQHLQEAEERHHAAEQHRAETLHQAEHAAQRAAAAAAAAEELRKDRRAAEVVAARLAERLRELEEESKEKQEEVLREQLGKEVWSMVQSAVQQHRARRSALHLSPEMPLENPRYGEQHWLEEGQCYTEELRRLRAQREEVDGRRKKLEKLGRADLLQAERLVEGLEEEAAQMMKQQEEILMHEKQRKVQKREIYEAEESLETLHDELQVAESCMNHPSEDLLASLLGRLGVLTKMQAVQQARLRSFRVARSAAASTESAPTSTLRRSAPPRAVPLESGSAQPVEASKLLEELATLRRDNAEQVERRKALQNWQDLDDSLAPSTSQRLPVLRRVPARLVRRLAQLVESSETIDLLEFQEVLGQLLALRKELQQEALDAQFSAEHFRSRVCSFDPSTAAVARRAHDRAAADSFRLHEEVMAQISMEEAAQSHSSLELAKLKAEASTVATELGEQRRRLQHLQQQHRLQSSTWEVEAAAAAARAAERVLPSGWRDEVVESVWTMAQRAGYVAESSSETEQVLKAAQVLRILAFQLTSMELAWWVQQHQLHCDRFLCANAQLAPTSDAEHAQLAPWRQRYAELEEAERLRRQALRLNSEV
ncbi:unnamed protein product, partial [Durusdinium trenchii]